MHRGDNRLSLFLGVIEDRGVFFLDPGIPHYDQVRAPASADHGFRTTQGMRRVEAAPALVRSTSREAELFFFSNFSLEMKQKRTKARTNGRIRRAVIWAR